MTEGEARRSFRAAMPEYVDHAELALRGAAAGINLLLAGLIAISPAPRARRWLAVLFLLGTASYILQSAPDRIDINGPLDPVTRFMSIQNTVFFWWFALSLFEDAFRWTWVKAVPFVLLILLHLPGQGAGAHSIVEQLIHSMLSIVLLGHAIWIALRDRKDDLVDPRRRFRLAFAFVIGATGVAIALAENIQATVGLPKWLTLFHAVWLAALTYFFAFWLLAANRALFGHAAAADRAPDASPESAPDRRPPAPADKPALDRLGALMADGVYREEGLTVARLADRVGVPEHQLRRLINRELGFRNFSAFLNQRRVAEARRMLGDAEYARKQILQIALDLGYGSVAPFNRAFKEATGKTPTEFRNEKLNGD